MSKKNILGLIVLGVMALNSCKKNSNTIEVIPPDAMSLHVDVDEETIQVFLKTHTYNYEAFQNPASDFDYSIVIDTLTSANSDKSSLWDLASSETISIDSSEFGLDDGEVIDHKYYYIIAREGAGQSPTVADSTLVKYKGQLLDLRTFDQSSQYLWQYLPFTIRGYYNSVSKLKGGTTVVENGDGTSQYADSGIGMFVFPSALGYYNNSSGIIGTYEPIMFTLELGNFVADTDYDNDGIPSILEDLNEDGVLGNDNTDEAIEVKSYSAYTANHLDADDDGDGIPTKEEIEIASDGTISYPDSDGDGIVDYLDAN